MITQTVRRAATIVAGALLTLSVPAVAKDVESRPSQAKDSVATAPATPDKAEKKYCIVDDLSGSHMRKKVCQTAQEWSRAGIEIADR